MNSSPPPPRSQEHASDDAAQERTAADGTQQHTVESLNQTDDALKNPVEPLNQADDMPMYLRAKVRETGSCISTMVASSGCIDTNSIR
jgi:hypothetical protein